MPEKQERTWCGHVHPNGRSHCVLQKHSSDVPHVGKDSIWTDGMVRAYLTEHVELNGGKVIWEKKT